MAIDRTVHAISHKGDDTVVLTGSLGTTQEMWKPWVIALDGKHQAIMSGIRSRSESPIPEGERDMSHLVADLIGVLNEEGVDCTHFVGFSLGGAIAQTIAPKHTDRVAGLTLSSTAPKSDIPEAWQEKAELVCDKSTVAFVGTVVRNWFTDGCSDITPELLAHFRGVIADCPDDGYIGACEALSHFGTRERLARITASTLVIAGKQDTSTSLDVITSPHDGIKGSIMVVISSTKRPLNQETPECFNSALLAHIDGIAGQRLIAVVESKK